MVGQLRQVWNRDTLPLYIAPFAVSFSNNVLWLAMPYIAARLGGSDTVAGLCTGLFMGAYAPMCLVTGFMLPHLNPKRAVQWGLSIMTLCAVGMVAVVMAAQWGYMAGHAAVILALMTAPYGMAMAFFWPYMVGWLSAGHEGAALNRRVQLFSASFSIANLLSPLVAGVLVQQSSIAPLIAPLVLLVSGVAVISLARRPETAGPQDTTGTAVMPLREPPHEQLLSLRWSARVLMVVQYLCYGMLRCQMPLLLTFNLGLSESLFGIVMAVLCGVNFLTYMAMGRTDRWHYQRWFLWASQVLMILTLVVILTSKSFVWLLVAGGLCGMAQSIIYGSHLYYSLTGAPNRSGVMGLHEFILAGCFFGGSFFAGRVSDHWGRYAPYEGGLILIGLGVVAQVVLWAVLKRKKPAGLQREDGDVQPARELEDAAAVSARPQPIHSSTAVPLRGGHID